MLERVTTTSSPRPRRRAFRRPAARSLKFDGSGNLSVEVVSLRIRRSRTEMKGDNVTPRFSKFRTTRIVKTVVAATTIDLLALGVPFGAGTPTVAAATTATGCGATSPGSTTLSLKVNGFTRTVIVHVPKS